MRGRKKVVTLTGGIIFAGLPVDDAGNAIPADEVFSVRARQARVKHLKEQAASCGSGSKEIAVDLLRSALDAFSGSDSRALVEVGKRVAKFSRLLGDGIAERGKKNDKKNYPTQDEAIARRVLAAAVAPDDGQTTVNEKGQMRFPPDKLARFLRENLNLSHGVRRDGRAMVKSMTGSNTAAPASFVIENRKDNIQRSRLAVIREVVRRFYHRDDVSSPDNDDTRARKIPGVKDSEGNPLYLPRRILKLAKKQLFKLFLLSPELNAFKMQYPRRSIGPNLFARFRCPSCFYKRLASCVEPHGVARRELAISLKRYFSTDEFKAARAACKCVDCSELREGTTGATQKLLSATAVARFNTDELFAATFCRSVRNKSLAVKAGNGRREDRLAPKLSRYSCTVLGNCEKCGFLRSSIVTWNASGVVVRLLHDWGEGSFKMFVNGISVGSLVRVEEWNKEKPADRTFEVLGKSALFRFSEKEEGEGFGLSRYNYDVAVATAVGEAAKMHKPSHKAKLVSKEESVVGMKKFPRKETCPLVVNCEKVISVFAWGEEARSYEEGVVKSSQLSLVMKKMMVHEAAQALHDVGNKLGSLYAQNEWFNATFKERELDYIEPCTIKVSGDFGATADLRAADALNCSVDGHAAILVLAVMSDWREVVLKKKSGNVFMGPDHQPLSVFLIDIESFIVCVPSTGNKSATFEVYQKGIAFVCEEYQRRWKDEGGLLKVLVALDNCSGQFRNSQHAWAMLMGYMSGDVTCEYEVIFAVPSFFKFIHDTIGGQAKAFIVMLEKLGVRSGTAWEFYTNLKERWLLEESVKVKLAKDEAEGDVRLGQRPKYRVTRRTIGYVAISEKDYEEKLASEENGAMILYSDPKKMHHTSSEIPGGSKMTNHWSCDGVTRLLEVYAHFCNCDPCREGGFKGGERVRRCKNPAELLGKRGKAVEPFFMEGAIVENVYVEYTFTKDNKARKEKKHMGRVVGENVYGKPVWTKGRIVVFVVKEEKGEFEVGIVAGAGDGLSLKVYKRSEVDGEQHILADRLLPKEGVGRVLYAAERGNSGPETETIKVVGKGEEIINKMLEKERRAVLEAPLVVA